MSGDVVEHWFNSTKTYLHLRHFKPPPVYDSRVFFRLSFRSKPFYQPLPTFKYRIRNVLTFATDLKNF